MTSLAGCASSGKNEKDPPDWSQSGDGWIPLFEDRKFDRGFGAGWIYGTSFTGDNALKKGVPLTYRDIGQDIYIQPVGKATKEDGVTSSGAENDTFWELEEGAKKNIVDELGSPVDELHDFRLCVKSEVNENADRTVQRLSARPLSVFVRIESQIRKVIGKRQAGKTDRPLQFL